MLVGMPTTIADIVAEELEAARARIAERIAALLGGASPRPTGRPVRAPAKREVSRVAIVDAERFQGRVRARMSAAEVADARRKVLAAVLAGASTAAEIQARTHLDRHRVTYAANALRAEGEIRRRGRGRRATYSAG